MTPIDRDAVLALLDRLIADPGHVVAARAIADVLRLQVERLPMVTHVE